MEVLSMDVYRALIIDVLSQFVLALRKSQKLSQEKMAEKLRISIRAYSNLERGIFCFSSRTFLFLLLTLSENEQSNLLSALRNKITTFDRRAA